MNACGPVVNGLNCMLAACDCSFCTAEQVGRAAVNSFILPSNLQRACEIILLLFYC